MQIPEKILVLIEKYQSGRITEDEQSQLNAWYHSLNNNETEITLDETERQLSDRIKSRLLETIRHEHVEINRRRR